MTGKVVIERVMLIVGSVYRLLGGRDGRGEGVRAGVGKGEGEGSGEGMGVAEGVAGEEVMI